MNDIKSLLTATLRLRILIKLLLRFSEQIDVSIDINTDFYVIKDFFFTEEVFCNVKISVYINIYISLFTES